MTYVVDASVVMKWFLPEADSDRADALLSQFLNNGVELIAPDLLLLETASAIWKRTVLLHHLSPAEAVGIFQDLVTLPLTLHPTGPLAALAFSLAMKYAHSVYDGVYCALAMDRGCEFVTADSALVTKFQRAFPFVRHLSTIQL